MINSNAPFPQANDFNKVIKILNTGLEENLHNQEYISRALGLTTSRQVLYYLSACDYLGITYKHKFTEYGVFLRTLSKEEQLIELKNELCSVPAFEYAINYYLSNEKEIDTAIVIELMRKTICFNSEAMYVRRASTVIAWAKWFSKK